MNRAKLVLASAIAVAISTAQAYTLDTDAEKVGYTIGADMGSTLNEFAGDEDSISFDALIVGLRDAYQGDELSMSVEEMDATMQTFAEKRMQELEQEQNKQAQENLKEGQAFLEENAEKEGVETTDSGLQYKVLEEGDGEKPSADSNVTVNYEGRLIDGTVFDSSENTGEPVTFDINAVIDGWVEGLQLMNEGSKYRFFIPADLAYGEMGAGPAVPPNSTLIFDVELLKINDDTSDSADQVLDSIDEDVENALEEAKANAEQAEQDAKQIAEEVQKEAKAADKEMAVEVEKAKVDVQQAVEDVERENEADAQAAEESEQQVETPEPKVTEVEDADAVSANAEEVALESQNTEVDANNNVQEMGAKAVTDVSVEGENDNNVVEDALEATGEAIGNATEAIGETVSDAADSITGTENKE